MTSVHNKQAVSVLGRYVASKSQPGKGNLRCEGFRFLQLWHRVQQIRMLQREVIRCIATSSSEAILDFHPRAICMKSSSHHLEKVKVRLERATTVQLCNAYMPTLGLDRLKANAARCENAENCVTAKSEM